MIQSSQLHKRNSLSSRMDGLLHRVYSMRGKIDRCQRTASNSVKVAFTFDVEEDWEESPFRRYYDSYRYMDSGAFRELVNGLSERDIAGTFYVTPNVARERPDELEYLEDSGQKIGAHLHVHNLHGLKYPGHSGDEDKVTFYDFHSKLRLMTATKDLLESAVAHAVVLYRSGRLACDSQVERAARRVGFRGIANHVGVFPIGSFEMWNIGVGRMDLFSAQWASVEKWVRFFEAWKDREKFIVFSAHPMLLYDRKKGVRRNLLKAYFEFLSILQSRSNVELTEQHEILRQLSDRDQP